MQTSLKTEKKAIEPSKRIFHHIKGKSDGPRLVFFAGMHGNEMAGVTALNNALRSIKPIHIKGEVYGIYGNIEALKSNKRFIRSDLNRMWTTGQLKDLEEKEELTHEELEQKELFVLIKKLLTNNTNPVYFIDLHTTSSKTLPFITINDAMINRKFSRCFPVPVVLGIEEYLEGPLLSYLNTKGFVAIGFEGGQHQDPLAVKSCEAFIHLALNCSGALKKPVHQNIQVYKDFLKNTAKHVSSVFEIIEKYHIQQNEQFLMEDGFISFQNIKKGTLLAHSDGAPIYAEHNAKLFMPLYQKSGNDGFFIIRPIPKFFLKFSELLRKYSVDNLLTFLPGISWENKQSGVLKANLSVTRFMAKSIFHLFGYRNKQLDKTHLLLYNRERVSKNEMYQNESWY